MTVSRDELVERFRQMAEMLRRVVSDDRMQGDLARLQSRALDAWDLAQTPSAPQRTTASDLEGAQTDGFVLVTSTTRWG